MIITLTNGVKVELKWSMLVLEYLEQYDGGLSQIKKDMKSKTHQLKLQNIMIYAAIRANYDEPLTYHETIRLFQFKDLNKINSFFEKNLQELDEFKKKGQKYIPPKKKKKK